VKFLVNEVCQTGSPGFIISDGTIGDLDFHNDLPLRFWMGFSMFNRVKTSGIGCDIAWIIVKVNYFYCNDCESVSVNFK
jgi:hypothetical protein